VGTYRIFFVSDLHGSEVCLRKFVNSVDAYHPDLLVYGGDILGKILVPLFDEANGFYHWYANGQREIRFSAADLPKVERQVADQGRYALTVTPDRWKELQGNREKLEEIILQLGQRRVREWLRLIEERLGPKGISVVMNVGNDDTDAVLDLLRTEGPSNLLVPEGQVVRAGPYEIFGCGYANMTPWRCARDLEEADLQKVLDRTIGQIDTARNTILDIHAPPSETALDLAPQLDANLKPKTVGGQMLLEHVGSTSVRRVVENLQPMLGLFGHIHESKAIDAIGRTPIVNPGSTYFSGNLQGVLLDLRGAELASHLFVTG
jgi:Icc-related predicted phosphoesterase